jgi:hypothetical protein
MHGHSGLWESILLNDLPADPIGAAWLAREYHIMPIGHLPVCSQVGGRRATKVDRDFRLETYPEAMRPAAEPSAHLQFHLRHEVPHLEFLARLFARTGSAFVQAWVATEPTGQYARRAAFLYEWLTGEALQPPKRLGGNYVAAVDAAKMVAASADFALKVPRWHVNDNLAGTRYFCPTIVKTDAFNTAAGLDVARLFGELSEEFGEDLLLRAAAWMTLRESKASFAIEGEAERATRIGRFADVMAKHTGQGSLPLTHDALALLQREILGDRTTVAQFGLRKSPVFIGETVHHQEVVHYVAPPAADVPQMLQGVQTFLDRTLGQSPVMRSAVASFGFVYVHPMADGNGRVHRFLINDVLRRDGVIPGPVILPISAVIMDDVGERRDYDRVLDEISKPLIRAIRDHVTFEQTNTAYPDGVVSNLTFSGDDLARPLWRYPDMGPHVVYLSAILARTIKEQMREESRHLRNHWRARRALKEIVEMPDPQADRVIRSVEQNQGQLTHALAKEMPVLRQPGIWEQLVKVITQAFREDSLVDSTIVERYRPGRPPGK